VQIRAASETAELEALLPLTADYQRFYEADEIDTERNRAFFARFLGASEVGALLGAWAGERALGFACLYWTLSSVEARAIALMNDLYVAPDARGADVGKQLIEAAAQLARERGLPLLRWMTALDNRRAQRLYERFDVQRSEWFEYELPL
jgi:GNAT superfamily N-acetyltransferase